VFHPTLPIAYSGCELKSQVQVFAVDASDPHEVRPRITPIQRLSTLPEGWGDTNYVGEIKVNPTGTHVYISNRGHDSIATFSVDPATGQLRREGISSTMGKTPRHFGLSPDGGFAVVGTQDSDMIKVFALCPETGALTTCVQELDIPTPNFVLFANLAPAGTTLLKTGASEAREQARVGGSAVRMASPVAVCAS